jgi:hypothetical protein
MMYIFEVPEGLDVTEDEVLQQAIASVGGQWPEPILPSTQPVDGRQIVLVYANASKADLEALIAGFSLTWDILATEGEPVDQAALIPFFTDVVTIDEDGNEISEPVTDLTDKLQVFSGHSWTY